MSYVFNMVGGGGGGSIKDTDAILTVTVETGSTVTATRGGVTLTPTIWMQAADSTLDYALFVIQPSLFDAVNAWTVTATLGTYSASDTIVIDAAYEYNIKLKYKTYLLKDGVIPTNPWGTYQNIKNTSFTSGQIVMAFNSSEGAFFGFSTASPTNYRTLHFNLSATKSAPESAYKLHVGVTSAKIPSNINMIQALSYYQAYTISGDTNGYVTIDVDISSVSQSFYVSAMCVASVYIKEIWMDSGGTDE